MDNKLQLSNLTRRRALGVFHVGGGIIGLALVAFSASGAGEFMGLSIGLLSVFLLLYAHAVYTGVLLLRKNGKGLVNSLVQQILQLVTFSFKLGSYMYVCGFGFSVGTYLDEPGLSYFYRLSAFSFRLGDSDHHYIYVNLAAVGLLYYLYVLKRNMDKEELLKQSDAIGEEIRTQSPG